MSKLSERHEVRVRDHGKTIVFVADSEDGRLVIRQEPDGGKEKDVCAITEQGVEVVQSEQPRWLEKPKDEERDALIAQVRERNAQAFAPWTKEEENEIRKRYEGGESLQSIARSRKRSPRAIELRLWRMGVLPPE